MLSPFQKIFIRLTVLFIILWVLLAVFVIKKNKEDDQIAAQKKSKFDAYFRDRGYNDPKLRAAKPLDFPDFGKGPLFQFRGDHRKLSEDIYLDAKDARKEIEALKLDHAGKTLNKPTELPLAENVPTARDFHEKYLKFRLQEWEAYRELTTDKEAVKQAGEKFLHAYLLRSTGQPDALSDAELVPLAKKVIALESNDPLLRTYAAYILLAATGDADTAKAMWSDCIEKLRESQYPLIVQVYLRLFVIDFLSNGGEGQRHALIVSIIHWLEEEADTEEWHDCVHRKLATIWDQNDKTFRSELLVGCLQSKKIDPFITHWLLGVYYVDKAWETRGGRLAQNMNLGVSHFFDNNLNRGKVHLEYAYFLRPDSLYPPYKLISAALNEQDDVYQPIDWFHRTVEKRFDHSSSYYSVLYFMLPRWGGNLNQCKDFAQKCIDSNRFDTHVPYFAIYVLQYLLNQEFEQDWEQLKSFGADEIIDDFLAKRAEYRATHPGEKLYGDTAYYRTNFGLFFEKMDRPQDAIAEFKAAQGDFDFSQLQHNHRLGKFLLCRLFATQGDESRRIMEFDKELRKVWPASTKLSEIDPLEKEWQELKQTAKEDLAKQYFDHTGEILKQLKTYFQGDWVELSFRNYGLGWEISSDQIDWNKQDPHLLVCREMNRSKPSWARPLINLEAPFQIQANAEQKASSPGSTQIDIRWTNLNSKDKETKLNLHAGVHGNWSFTKSKTPNEFRNTENLKCGFNVSYADRSMKSHNSQYIRVMNTGMHLIDWKLRTHSNELTLGNYPEFVRFDNPIIPQSHLIISSKSRGKSFRLPSTPDFVWKLKNVRIRRLPAEDMPAEDTAIEKRSAYWEKRVNNDPEDAVARLKLCELYWEQGRVNELLEQSNEILSKWPELEKIQQYRGLALYKRGRYREAMAALELAAKEYRDDIDVIMALAEIKAASNEEELRDKKESLGLAKFGKRCSVSYRTEFTAAHWAALAIAYADNNNFEEAKKANQEAITLAKDNLKTELQDRQKLYEAAKPYRYPVGK